MSGLTKLKLEATSYTHFFHLNMFYYLFELQILGNCFIYLYFGERAARMRPNSMIIFTWRIET